MSKTNRKKKGITLIIQGVFIVMVIYFWMLSVIPVLTVACLCLVYCGIRRKPPLLLYKLWLWLPKEERTALAKDHAPALYNQQIAVFSLCTIILGVIFINLLPPVYIDIRLSQGMVGFLLIVVGLVICTIVSTVVILRRR